MVLCDNKNHGLCRGQSGLTGRELASSDADFQDSIEYPFNVKLVFIFHNVF